MHMHILSGFRYFFHTYLSHLINGTFLYIHSEYKEVAKLKCIVDKHHELFFAVSQRIGESHYFISIGIKSSTR